MILARLDNRDKSPEIQKVIKQAVELLNKRQSGFEQLEDEDGSSINYLPIEVRDTKLEPILWYNLYKNDDSFVCDFISDVKGFPVPFLLGSYITDYENVMVSYISLMLISFATASAENDLDVKTTAEFS